MPSYISIDHYSRRGMSEAELLALKTKFETEIDNVSNILSTSSPGLSVSFETKKLELLSEQWNSIMYALNLIDPVTYALGEKNPTSFKILRY
jgi:hypothetical protein